MKHILYIEDDYEIGQWVSNEFREQGYQVTWLQTGERALEVVGEADVVVLDVMLPGLDGFTIGHRLKKEQPDVPIMMLSARTAVEDKLQGLAFADDYVTKPFHSKELLARIEVLLRRFERQENECITLGHLQVYPAENRIMNQRTNEEIILTGKQYQIFHYFIRHRNQILTKEQLFEGVWGEVYIQGDKTLMVHIRYLREKLEEDPANPKIIETIRGIGYRLKV